MEAKLSAKQAESDRLAAIDRQTMKNERSRLLCRNGNDYKANAEYTADVDADVERKGEGGSDDGCGAQVRLGVVGYITLLRPTLSRAYVGRLVALYNQQKATLGFVESHHAAMIAGAIPSLRGII